MESPPSHQTGTFRLGTLAAELNRPGRRHLAEIVTGDPQKNTRIYLAAEPPARSYAPLR